MEHRACFTVVKTQKQTGVTVLWLDLKNTYGSIPHKLVEEALQRHHVSNKITELIVDYYNNFQMRMVSERGIITGCTISATLFCLAMNMIIKATEVEGRQVPSH